MNDEKINSMKYKMLKEYEHFSKGGETLEEAVRRLYEIVAVLRKKCPWDIRQTHESLRGAMIEEIYEAVDAIDRGDMENLREELGDVTLHVVFNSSLAEENGDFNLVDVLNEECDKMIRRHPHVFSAENTSNKAKTVDKVLEKWENIKSKEHSETDVSQSLADVPNALPSLMRSYKIQKKAAKMGFDWDDKEGALEKVMEEFKELKEAISEGSLEHMDEELGDLLFSVVNVSRFLKINPELALKASSDKFISRFQKMEEIAAREGESMEDMNVVELDLLWQRAKKELSH
ncbi:nucleoside triphosphate pyrophosphohydrolase [Anaerovoracaceae bacterium SGI.195]